MTILNRQQRPDPVEVLAGLLDAIDVRHRADGQTLTRNERNRLDLLVVHALAGLCIGPLFATMSTSTGSPTWIVLRQIPGNPYTMAVVLFTGGAVLLPSTLARARRWEVAGLSLIFGWYAVMALGFAGAVLWWVADGLPPQTRPGLYPALVYGHLSIVMAVHIRTLVRMRRAEL